MRKQIKPEEARKGDYIVSDKGQVRCDGLSGGCYWEFTREEVAALGLRVERDIPDEPEVKWIECDGYGVLGALSRKERVEWEDSTGDWFPVVPEDWDLKDLLRSKDRFRRAQDPDRHEVVVGPNCGTPAGADFGFWNATDHRVRVTIERLKDGQR